MVAGVISAVLAGGYAAAASGAGPDLTPYANIAVYDATSSSYFTFSSSNNIATWTDRKAGSVGNLTFSGTTRPTYTYPYVSYAATAQGDQLLTTFAGSTFPSSSRIFFRVRRGTDETTGALCEGQANTRYLAAFDSTDTSSPLTANAGTPTVWVDEVQVTTRQGLYNALAAGGRPWVTVEVRTANLDAWTSFEVPYGSSASFHVTGDYAYIVMVSEAFLTSNPTYAGIIRGILDDVA